MPAPPWPSWPTAGTDAYFDAILIDGWKYTLLIHFRGALIGLVVAYILMILIYWLFQDSTPKRMDFYFRSFSWYPLPSSAFLTAPTTPRRPSGSLQDVLVSARFLDSFQVPNWVIIAAYAAIALGTLSGGWRIIHTMGSRLTKLKPRGGFAPKPRRRYPFSFPLICTCRYRPPT